MLGFGWLTLKQADEALKNKRLEEAQRLLTQSEIDDALARLSVWRALLDLAAATGAIDPFLAEASR